MQQQWHAGLTAQRIPFFWDFPFCLLPAGLAIQWALTATGGSQFEALQYFNMCLAAGTLVQLSNFMVGHLGLIWVKNPLLLSPNDAIDLGSLLLSFCNNSPPLCVAIEQRCLFSGTDSTEPG